MGHGQIRGEERYRSRPTGSPRSPSAARRHAGPDRARTRDHACPGEALRFAKETPQRYEGALAKAGTHIAQGDHFGAGDVFTEEFTAPVATAIIGVVEGGVALTRVGGRALARAGARTAVRDGAADTAAVESGFSEGQKTAVLRESAQGNGTRRRPGQPQCPMGRPRRRPLSRPPGLQEHDRPQPWTAKGMSFLWMSTAFPTSRSSASEREGPVCP